MPYKDPEQRKRYLKKWRKLNAEYNRWLKRRHHAENREHETLRMRNWYRKNRQHHLLKVRERRQTHGKTAH